MRGGPEETTQTPGFPPLTARNAGIDTLFRLESRRRTRLDTMSETRQEWEQRMRQEHDNPSEAQLQNWWEMKQAGESRSGSSSSAGGGAGIGEGYTTRGSGDQFDVPQEAIARVREARQDDTDRLSDNEVLAGTYTGTRQELPDGSVRESPAGQPTPDMPEPEPEPEDEGQGQGGAD